MEIIKLVNPLWGPLSEFLIGYMGWHSIIFFYSLISYAYSQFAWTFMSKELRKRKEIIQDIHLYKMTHPDELYPKVSDNSNKSLFMINKVEYPDKYYLALEKLIKKRKAHPLLAIFLLFFQYILVASIIGYLMFSNSNLLPNDVYYYLAIGLMIMRMLNKKLVYLKIFFIGISFFAYKLLSPDAMIFIFYLSLFGFINFVYLKFKLYRYKKTL